MLHLDQRGMMRGRGEIGAETVLKVEPRCLLLEKMCGARAKEWRLTPGILPDHLKGESALTRDEEGCRESVSEVGWDQELVFGHDFELSVGHPSGTVKWAVR